MELRFIGQGYNTAIGTSVAQSLINSLADDTFHTFKCLVAFASYSGITGLTSSINNSRHHINSARVIVGIDQLGTSKEALEALLDWNADSFVFNTKTPIIFHPKIYIFEGDLNVKIIIGSNNLTQTGLSQNIEGSIEVSFTKDEEQGMRLLEEISTYYEPLLNGSHVNLERLSTELITRLVNEGKVPTEEQRRAQHNKARTQNSPSVQEDTRETIFPPIPIQTLPAGFTPARLNRVISTDSSSTAMATVTVLPSPNPAVSSTVINYTEVWKSKPLTERDLNIPTGANTNATGSMLLKKGLLPSSIDHRHHFRDAIFNNLTWVRGTGQKSHLEKAVANFKIKIDGVDKGQFLLSLGHNTKTDIATYRQNNAMSQLHWGAAKDLIANRALLGKTLTLFKDSNSDDKYAIEIQ